MIEELDLLNRIAGKGGENKPGVYKRAKYEASIITTFNAYLPFYEEVLLRRLASSGCQYNVLLMDNKQLAQSMASPTAQPRLAGRRYTLMPMRAGGAFHPKVALLVGKNSSRVFIGSHNVTLSGFGHNREITTVVDINKGGEYPYAPLACAVWKFLNSWIKQQDDHISSSIIKAAQKIATNFAPWLRDEEEQKGEIRFFGAEPAGDSLWNRVRPILPQQAKRVIAIGPFFDRAGKFIETLAKDLQTSDIVIGVEPKTVSLCRTNKLPVGVCFVDSSSLGRGENTGYLHAKVLYIEGKDGQCALITGSANPSSPAWDQSPNKRNSEAVIVHLGDSAKKFAKDLEITTLASMPKLKKETLESLVIPPREKSKSETVHILIAEALEKEITVYYPGLKSEQIKEVRCWDYAKGKYFFPIKIISDDQGLRMQIEEQDKVYSIEILLKDGRQFQAFVHHPAEINRLNRTSKQRKFQDAFNSLDSSSPDLPTLIRLASNLIFDEDVITPTSASRSTKDKTKDSGSESLPPLEVSITDTKASRKKTRELRGGDLAYIIDTLIFNLGQNLETQSEQFDEVGPSEEEQVGQEEDASPPLDDPLNADLIKMIQGKIKTLINRMLKVFDKNKGPQTPTYRPAEQLLAVLAIIREVRIQDKKFSQLTFGKSLVPLDYRKKLFEGSISALFGHEHRLFDLFANTLDKDPDEDVPRLLGLMFWLAYDSGLDVREFQDFLPLDIEEKHNRLFNLSRMLEIAVAAGNDNSVFNEAEQSIWKTTSESMKGNVSRWTAYHRAWSNELLKIFPGNNIKNIAQGKVGGIGIAQKGTIVKPRIIFALDKSRATFVELGRKKNIILFSHDVVCLIDMPTIIQNRL